MAMRRDAIQVKDAAPPRYGAQADAQDVPPGYKRTEVGLVPKDWRVSQLGDFGTLRSGNGFPLKHQGRREGHYPFFKVSDMNNPGNELFMDHSNHWIDEAVRRALSAEAFPAGSIVFAKIGAAIFLERKRLLVRDSCLDNNMMAYVLSDRSASTRFFHYVLLRFELAKLVSTTALPSLSGRQIASVQVPIPAPAEQRAIAEALSDVDGLLGALEALIAKKRAIKQAAMQQLLSGKTRLPGFSGEWDTKRLGRCGSTYGGITGKGKADFGHGSARYVTFLNVLENATVQPALFEAVDIGSAETQNRVRRGDVLFNGTSETPEDVALGACVLGDWDDLYLNSFCFGLRFHSDSDHDPLFFAYFFRGPTGRQLISALAQGATRYNISKRQLLRLECPLPNGDEQRAIAKVLSDMDAEIAALEARRDKTHAIKQGMMQQLLTGRVRLVKPEAAA